MHNSFYSEEELSKINFKKIGKKCLISRFAHFYGADKITIGDNVRIDDFSILSGEINIGSYIHISAGVHMFAGNYGIELKDFTTVSGRCSIYALTDDYLGDFMTNSTLPNEYRNVLGKKIVLERHAIIGSNSVILPGSYLAEGAAVGANSLLNNKTEAFSIYVGSPAKKIKERSRKLLDLEDHFVAQRKDK